MWFWAAVSQQNMHQWLPRRHRLFWFSKGLRSVCWNGEKPNLHEFFNLLEFRCSWTILTVVPCLRNWSEYFDKHAPPSTMGNMAECRCQREFVCYFRIVRRGWVGAPGANARRPVVWGFTHVPGSAWKTVFLQEGAKDLCAKRLLVMDRYVWGLLIVDKYRFALGYCESDANNYTHFSTTRSSFCIRLLLPVTHIAANTFLRYANLDCYIVRMYLPMLLYVSVRHKKLFVNIVMNLIQTAL